MFGARRVTVKFEFTDVPKAKRRWWIVNDRGTVDLCPTDPGFPIDIYITTDIRTMVHIWVRKLSLAAAVNSERMEIIGPRALRDHLAKWFLYSPININSLSNPLLKTPSDKAGAVPRRTGALRQRA